MDFVGKDKDGEVSIVKCWWINAKGNMITVSVPKANMIQKNTVGGSCSAILVQCVE
jgi:hypothetical protein